MPIYKTCGSAYRSLTEINIYPRLYNSWNWIR